MFKIPTYDTGLLYGGLAIILRALFYISCPIIVGLLIRQIVSAIKNNNGTSVCKGVLVLIFVLVYAIVGFLNAPSLPVSIKTNNISAAAKEFEKVSSGEYRFSYGFCTGTVFVYNHENVEESEKSLRVFADYHDANIQYIDGVGFSKSSYECFRGDYEGFFIGLVSSEAEVGIALDKKYVEISYSYFQNGLNSIFSGLIPLDMIIRPRLNLLKVAENMEFVNELPNWDDYEDLEDNEDYEDFEDDEDLIDESICS